MEFHRKSIRLPEYDYSRPGAYFITIVTKNREPLFGEISNGEVILYPLGKIVYEEWLRTPIIRSEIILDSFMVMPNHIHGIIQILDNDSTKIPVGAHSRAPLLQRQTKSVGSFVAGFKSIVTSRINEYRKTPGCPVWQRNYYEHIIRNEDDLRITREYIHNNPLRWEVDK